MAEQKTVTAPMSEGARLISEVAHVIKFMQKMGYATKGMTSIEALSIRKLFIEELTCSGHIQDETKVRNAFK